MRTSYGKPTRICRKCDSKQRNARYKKRPRSVSRQKRIEEKKRRQSKDPSRRGYFINKWSRKSDRKWGRDNDLTIEFCENSIKGGCSYCGMTSVKMTLDRINNHLGHLQSNVVPACIRCNYIRRDIPYEAWLVMVPAVKEAIEKGLFGDWDGSYMSVTSTRKQRALKVKKTSL